MTAPLEPALLVVRWPCVGMGGEVAGEPQLPRPCFSAPAPAPAQRSMPHRREVRGIPAVDSAVRPVRRLRALHGEGREHFFKRLLPMSHLNFPIGMGMGMEMGEI